MSYIDIVIIIGGVAAAYQGLRRGLFRQAGSLVGFWAGIVMGLLIAVRLTPPNLSTGLRAEAIVILSLTCASIVGFIGGIAGATAARLVRKASLGWLDAVAGALLRAAAFLVFVWIAVSFLSASLPSSFRRDLRQSAVLTALDRYAPPVPAALAKLATLATPQVLPKVGPSFSTPSVPVEAPPPVAIQAAVAKDQDSVVKVEGTACGSLDAGTGFVIAPGAVVTNAHVVAGIRQAAVLDRQGRWFRGVVVLYDPDLDLAVLHVSQLTAPALPFSEVEAVPGSGGAALGYPGGGSFKAVPAAVFQLFTAIGPNLYGDKQTRRQVYELKADVMPGNSGGPFVDQNGTVQGIVFGRSGAAGSLGYALDIRAVAQELRDSQQKLYPVDTGECISE